MKRPQQPPLPPFLFRLLVFILPLITIIPLKAEQKGPPIKIGVMLPLSGPVAETGTSVMQSIQLADLHFDSDNRVEFIFEDDQMSAKMAVGAVEKLINQQQVSALISFSGTVSLAVAPIAERRGIPLIAITPLTKVSAGRKFVYTIFVPTSELNRLLMSAMEELKLMRAAVVTTQQDALLGIRDAFVEKYRDRIVWQQEIPPGDTNLHTTVTKLLAQKPDVVYELTLPPQTSRLAKLLREQGYKGRIVGGPPMSIPDEIKAAQGALTGAILPGPDREVSAKVLAEYQSKFRSACVSEGLYGYDAASIFISLAASENFISAFQQLETVSGLLGSYRVNDENLIDVPGRLLTIAEDGDVRGWKTSLDERAS